MESTARLCVNGLCVLFRATVRGRRRAQGGGTEGERKDKLERDGERDSDRKEGEGGRRERRKRVLEIPIGREITGRQRERRRREGE